MNNISEYINELMASNEDESFVPIMHISDEDEKSEQENVPETLPLLALKNTVLFPGVLIPITVGRSLSLKAVQYANKRDKMIAVITQTSVEEEFPSKSDLFQVGTVAQIMKVLSMPDGSTTILLQGKRRFELLKLEDAGQFLMANIEAKSYKPLEEEQKIKFQALISKINDASKKIIELSPNLPKEAAMVLKNIKSDFFLLNFISSNLNLDVSEKQEILEIDDLLLKAERVDNHLSSELKLLEVRRQIEGKVRGEIEKQQRDYFLNQQLKTIKEELGDKTENNQLEEYKARAKKKNWPEYVEEKFEKEIARVERMNSQSPEYSVRLNYLELLLDLPWDNFTKDNFDLKRARKILDKDHFGLDKVKQRIIEHLAVLKLKGDMKAPILCLVGPPGVGKTSLGRSIAKALSRNFVRMSLGGLHDESEIRGHRKTYIGAMPGRIIQEVKKAGTSNPVFILDEIDKLGKDFRGDPSSALLEVLDPEQNNTFYDNYLELEYDLSKMLFIATANSLDGVQPALKDRMEIIKINGYSTEEKIEIAKLHLIPKLLKEHGMKKSQITIPRKTLAAVIQNYTRESGVRNLNRRLAALMRHRAGEVAMDKEFKKSISIEEANDILGPSVFNPERYSVVQTTGVAVGLAYTPTGGEILFIEASKNTGKGKLILTGNLGDVMKESATTALSFIKAHAKVLNITDVEFDKLDIHVHVPEGAVPKDGPSAGITILTALASMLSEKQVRSYMAMSGEITLRGQVLPVGGIKEKVLAAKRAGIKQIILCKENEKNVKEIEPQYIKDIEFIYVESMEEVLEITLQM